MAKDKYQLIEKRYDMPMIDILKMLRVQCGTVSKMAQVLDVSQPTVSDWWCREGLPELYRISHQRSALHAAIAEGMANGKTQSQLARELGISRQRVNQIVKAKKMLAGEGVTP